MEYLLYALLTMILIFMGLKLANLNKKDNNIITKDDDYIEFL